MISSKLKTRFNDRRRTISKQYRQHKFIVSEEATDIYLVRHGESRAAIDGELFPLLEGQGDPELSSEGRLQATAVGERLARLNVDSVYVTSLKRTAETAEPLCKKLNIVPIVEPDLREVHLGDWEGGIFRVKVHENDPLYQKMQREQRWDVIPGAESIESLRLRIGNALSGMIRDNPGRLVVAFVHGGVIGHILAEATKSEAFAFSGSDNGSISRIVAVDGKLIVRAFNQADHLTSIASGSHLPT